MESAVKLQSNEINLVMKNSSLFKNHVPEVSRPKKEAKEFDLVEAAERSLFMTENAYVFANAATIKLIKRTRKTLGLSAQRTLQTDYQLKPLSRAVSP